MQLFHGDCRDVIKTLPACSVDSVVTDPPYSLVSIQKRFGKPGSAPAQHGRDGLYKRASAGFMNKQWDTGETAFDPDFWAEVMRVLKPGGHLLAFGGTRTYHRLACAIEDAGFEIRDQIGWLYGSGFPKSHNQHGEWEGWGTALKPAWEPIVLARKPLIGTVAENVLQHGTGALNIDGSRVEAEKATGWGGKAAGGNTWDETNNGLGKDGAARPVDGRWPANVIHDGSEEVLAAFPNAPGQIAKASSSSETRKTQNVYGAMARGSDGCEPRDHGGSAARFFYCAKATAKDRRGSKHPTVKPISLLRYLCRLVTPPGGVVLDPFAGSGTLGEAAIEEGFTPWLIEREDEYFADIQRRMQEVVFAA